MFVCVCCHSGVKCVNVLLVCGLCNICPTIGVYIIMDCCVKSRVIKKITTNGTDGGEWVKKSRT